MWRTRALGVVQRREGGGEEGTAPGGQGCIVGGVQGVQGARGAAGQRLGVRLLRAEQTGDLAARLGRRGYVNGVHRVSLLPILYVVVVAVGHPQDLAHRAQASKIL